MWELKFHLDTNDHPKTKFQTYERFVQGAHMSKDSKKNWCSWMLEWMWAALQNGNASRWVRYVHSEFTGVRHVVEMKRSWREVHSCAVYGGFAPTRRLLQNAAPIGVPEEPRYHWLFSFFLFQLEFFMSLYKRALSLFLFSRVEFATSNLCQ